MALRAAGGGEARIPPAAIPPAATLVPQIVAYENHLRQRADARGLDAATAELGIRRAVTAYRTTYTRELGTRNTDAERAAAHALAVRAADRGLPPELRGDETGGAGARRAVARHPDLVEFYRSLAGTIFSHNPSLALIDDRQGPLLAMVQHGRDDPGGIVTNDAPAEEMDASEKPKDRLSHDELWDQFQKGRFVVDPKLERARRSALATMRVWMLRQTRDRAPITHRRLDLVRDQERWFHAAYERPDTRSVLEDLAVYHYNLVAASSTDALVTRAMRENNQRLQSEALNLLSDPGVCGPLGIAVTSAR